MSDPWPVIGGISAGLAGLGLVVSWLRMSPWAKRRAECKRLEQERDALATAVYRDWLGESPRPGFEGRPSFPERMTGNERANAETLAKLSAIHETVDDISARTTAMTEAQSRLEFRQNGQDRRITDHAARNEATAAALRTELERRADELQAGVERHADELKRDLQARNDVVDGQLQAIDHRLDTLSGDLLRAEVYRASLVEMGLPIDEPHHPEQRG